MKTSTSGIHNSLEAFLETLKRLPFVRKVQVDGIEERGATRQDALLTIVDPEKRRWKFSAEIKRSYLDRSLTNAVIARAILSRPSMLSRKMP